MENYDNTVNKLDLKDMYRILLVEIPFEGDTGNLLKLIIF